MYDPFSTSQVLKDIGMPVMPVLILVLAEDMSSQTATANPGGQHGLRARSSQIGQMGLIAYITDSLKCIISYLYLKNIV